MMTAVAATLLTLAAVSPQVSTSQDRPQAAATKTTAVVATALPTPGAWALMGMGCLALVRARRIKNERPTH